MAQMPQLRMEHNPEQLRGSEHTGHGRLHRLREKTLHPVVRFKQKTQLQNRLHLRLQLRQLRAAVHRGPEMAQQQLVKRMAEPRPTHRLGYPRDRLTTRLPRSHLVAQHFKHLIRHVAERPEPFQPDAGLGQQREQLQERKVLGVTFILLLHHLNERGEYRHVILQPLILRLRRQLLTDGEHVVHALVDSP